MLLLCCGARHSSAVGRRAVRGALGAVCERWGDDVCPRRAREVNPVARDGEQRKL